MLYQFLSIIQSGEAQTLLEIARQMDITLAMVIQMADQLTHQGYLQEIGRDCTGHEEPCTDCLSSSSCQEIFRRWILTDKGKARVMGATL